MAGNRFFDDALLPLLRVLTTNSPKHELAREYLLCFIGDAADLQQHHPSSTFKSRPLIGSLNPSHDLMEALAAIRQQLNLPKDHFRVEGLYANRRLSKAHVNW